MLIALVLHFVISDEAHTVKQVDNLVIVHLPFIQIRFRLTYQMGKPFSFHFIFDFPQQVDNHQSSLALAALVGIFDVNQHNSSKYVSLHKC